MTKSVELFKNRILTFEIVAVPLFLHNVLMLLDFKQFHPFPCKGLSNV